MTLEVKFSWSELLKQDAKMAMTRPNEKTGENFRVDDKEG